MAVIITITARNQTNHITNPFNVSMIYGNTPMLKDEPGGKEEFWELPHPKLIKEKRVYSDFNGMYLRTIAVRKDRASYDRDIVGFIVGSRPIYHVWDFHERNNYALGAYIYCGRWVPRYKKYYWATCYEGPAHPSLRDRIRFLLSTSIDVRDFNRKMKDSSPKPLPFNLNYLGQYNTKKQAYETLLAYRIMFGDK